MPNKVRITNYKDKAVLLDMKQDTLMRIHESVGYKSATEKTPDIYIHFATSEGKPTQLLQIDIDFAIHICQVVEVAVVPGTIIDLDGEKLLLLSPEDCLVFPEDVQAPFLHMLSDSVNGFLKDNPKKYHNWIKGNPPLEE